MIKIHKSAYKVTGPFVAMIRYMIVRDLRQFSLIYLIFLCSFAQCFFFINRPQANQQQQQHNPPITINSTTGAKTTLNNIEQVQWQSPMATDRTASASIWLDYVRLWLELFKMTLGVYELEPFRHSILARLFLLLFIYLIPILFNM